MEMVTVDKQVDRNDRQAFGAFLASLRLHAGAKKIKQTRILAHLPNWVHSSYSRLEDGLTSPRFTELPALYAAFLNAGVVFSSSTRQQFVVLARKRIELQRTYKDRRTNAEWAQLLLDLMQLDGQAEIGQQGRFSQPFLADVGHLVDRPLWHEELKGLLSPARGKKLVIVRGTAGVGKSSELSRLAIHQLGLPSCQVIFCNLRSHGRARTPEEALEEFLGTVFTELSVSLPRTPALSFEDQTALLLDQFERVEKRLVLLIDHGECLMQENQRLAPCWERFFSAFLRGRHQAKTVVATRLWLGWTGSDPLFVDETTIPPLSEEQTVCLLQRLGLREVPIALLQEVYHTIGGIPLCLEWVAALIKRPQQDDWESFEMDDAETTHAIASPAMMTGALQRLLAGPRVFGESAERVVTPFLERLLSSQSLSVDALHVLQVLSVAAIPLAKPSLEIICRSGPGPYDELRRASLVVASRARTQLLPMVAASVFCSLSAEQVLEGEHLLVEAYMAWLAGGMVYEREAGGIVNELAVLLLKHRRLLDAAQLLIRYGWLAFNLGYTMRLAQLAADILAQGNWHTTEEDECGGLLLHYFLSPFLGKELDITQRVADYRCIREVALTGKIVLQPPIVVSVTHNLMQQALNERRFGEAQTLLDTSCTHLEPFLSTSVDLRASLLEKRAWLFSVWSEHYDEQGDGQTASQLREQAIALYRRCSTLLSTSVGQSLLASRFLKKRHARILNFLGYYLGQAKRYEQALQALRDSMALQELGYAEVDGLAPVYGDISQTFMELGRFQEALRFDDKAYQEAQRLANAGYTFSKEELHIYRVNRGCLYLRVGRIDEAEQLFCEALPKIHPRRRRYQVIGDKALQEIEAWRRTSAASSHYQLDWRWVDRYRELASFNAYWWLAAAGPFTPEEQYQWNLAFSSNLDEATKEQLGKLIDQSRDRELSAAITEQREPRLSYPAIDIVDVRRRTADLQALQAEIDEQEPHALVRRFYQGTIEEEVAYLRLIEATYDGDSQRFWEHNLRINPRPTPEDMDYALSRVRHIVVQGVIVAERSTGIEPERKQALQETSAQVTRLLREHLHLQLELSCSEAEAQALLTEPPLSSSPRRMVSAETAKRFFEAVLRDSGYEGWQVVIDARSTYAHIEQGLRHFYLPASAISLQQIKDLLTHELAVHVARCVSGQRTLLGLLGIHTEHSLETEEGLGTYYEIEIAKRTGQTFDETGVWFGTLATGLATGVRTPPQRFLSVVTFFETFIYLYRLLMRPDQDVSTAQRLARKHAVGRAIRTFRGLPDLQREGVCNCKDAHYVPGLRKIEHAVVERGEVVLDELAAGVIALENLPLLKELGIVTVPQPLRQLIQDTGLDAHILAFEEEQNP